MLAARPGMLGGERVLVVDVIVERRRRSARHG
jgi:hypothetical protein